MTTIAPDIERHWVAVSPLLTIRDEREYDVAVERLNKHEEEHHPIPECSGADVFRFLMEEHGLTQSDLPEIGSQGVVSEILNGKRELNVRQIRALAARFHVSPAAFI
jgi:HTH-type transcriptional regulator/antitoxin HigA